MHKENVHRNVLAFFNMSSLKFIGISDINYSFLSIRLSTSLIEILSNDLAKTLNMELLYFNELSKASFD